MISITLAFSIGIILAKYLFLTLDILFPAVFIFSLIVLYVFFKKYNLWLFLLILACLMGGINFQLRGAPQSPENRYQKTEAGFTIALRDSFNQTLLKILPEKEAVLLGSILLGASVSPLPEETKETYRRAGLIHLLVVSGTQVSILIGVCLGLTRAMKLPNGVGILLTTGFNVLLTLVTGAGASILRAAIMGEITLLGLLFEREKESYTALALSAFVLLLIDPANLFDIGFQLSFAATWGLMYIAPLLAVHMGKVFSITLAPMLATVPLIAYYFSQISPGGIIANLLVLPWMEVLVIFGLLTTLLGFVFLPLAQILGATLWFLIFILDQIAEGIAALPLSSFYITTPSLLIIFGYYAGLILMLEYLRREGRIIITRKRLIIGSLGLCLCLCLHFACSIEPSFGKCLTVSVIDVGEGDSILIESPVGRKILIDAADRKMVKRSLIPFLCRRGVKHIDLMILSHLHEDHMGGLPAVMQALTVDKVLQPINLVVGESINLGEGVSAQVLHANAAEANENNNSVVLRLRYGHFSMLLAGDNEQEGEAEILRSPADILQSTVLKVGHHGSNTSTSLAFLEAVKPRFAIISCGRRNKFHHPHRSTLERLLQFCRVYRTDLDGTVVVRSDGERVMVGR
ncbi:MAG: DNA internalization-related competence protein ComEC/Rec2 [Candidatus Margulisiibacteriota bacterium]